MRNFRNLFLLLSCADHVAWSHDDGSDFYGKLGVEKNASTKEIRKAFKKLAYTMHPDKSDDPDAHNKFVEINRIYEVLKDDEQRKKYDRWGEKGLEDDFHGNRYESWDFYHEELGLYDEDHEIHVLDYKELINAMASDDVWFIKFYSERCSHCHDLAPTWREVAIQLEGIVKIGAISCRDYRNVCQMLQISGYPTLMLFKHDGRRYTFYRGGPKVRHSQGKYKGTRNTPSIVEYALEYVQLKFRTLTNPIALGHMLNKAALYILSDSDGEFNIKELPDQYRIQTALGGLINIAKIPCDGSYDWKMLCSRRWTDEGGVFFYEKQKSPKNEDGVEIRSFDAAEIINQVFAQIELPQIETAAGLLQLSKFPIIVILDGNRFSALDMNTLKRLPNYVENHQAEFQWLSPTSSIRRIDCIAHADICDDIDAGGYNKIVVFSGFSRYEYEVYHGKVDVNQILDFAEDVVSNRMFTITSKNHDILLNDGSEWMLDFSAPWCPPCNEFLPQVRMATTSLRKEGVKIGYVDCDAHKPLCRKYKIQSYPTIKFIGFDENGNRIESEFDGDHEWEELVEFYADVKNPAVVRLDMQSFYQDVVGRDDGVIWMVDFAASWCPPCKRMFPEFKKAAKSMKGFIKFGYVECPDMSAICEGYGVKSYPKVKVFPGKTETTPVPNIKDYHYQRRDEWAFLHFLSTEIGQAHPVLDGTRNPSVSNMINAAFDEGKIVVVDFFANWCNPCQQFAPYFRLASGMMPNVEFINVDCAMSYGTRHCKSYNIRQYPTLFIFRPNRQRVEIEIHYDVNDLITEIETFMPEELKQEVKDEL